MHKIGKVYNTSRFCAYKITKNNFIILFFHLSRYARPRRAPCLDDPLKTKDNTDSDPVHRLVPKPYALYR